jgi:hypothetical protein
MVRLERQHLPVNPGAYHTENNNDGVCIRVSMSVLHGGGKSEAETSILLKTI